MSQGFAAVASSSNLYDAAGDDRYELVVDDVVLLPSSQDASVNLSLGQGTALGWRDDAQGLHLSGGVALLRDATGNDTYEGGVFAQGTGYWMSVGVFADGEGRDRYDGAFYAQGAAAHFAAAAFLETAGDDDYGFGRDPIQSALGLGHDFSNALVLEGGGNDRYRAPRWSLGATTCRGSGVFIELSGNDEYTPLAGETLGAAGNTCSDAAWPSFGLFVDAGGEDAYAARGNDDSIWALPPEDPVFIQGGLDTASGAFGPSVVSANPRE
jgi:hypothetical protein